MHKESKYVFFLDDDVQLCPGTIGSLVAHMIKYPEVCYGTSWCLCSQAYNVLASTSPDIHDECVVLIFWFHAFLLETF